MNPRLPLLAGLVLVLAPLAPAQDGEPESRLDRYRFWAEAGVDPELKTMLLDLAREEDPALSTDAIAPKLLELERRLREVERASTDPELLLADWSIEFYERLGFRHAEPQGPGDFASAHTLPGVLAGRSGGRIGLASVLLVLAREMRLDVEPALVGLVPILRREVDGVATNFDLARRGQDVPDDVLAGAHAWTDEGRGGPERVTVLDDRRFVALFLLERARARLASDRDDEARIDLAGAALLYPGLAAVHASLGDLALEGGDAGGALEAYRRAIAAGSRSLAVYERAARILVDQGRLEEALEAYRGALVQSPQNLQSWLGVASLHEARKDYARAIEALDDYLARAAELDGRNRSDVVAWRARLVGLQQIERIGPDRPFEERIHALARLESGGSPDVVPLLFPFLDEKNYRLRWATAHALARIAKADEPTARRLGVDRAAWEAWWAGQKK